MSRWRQLKNVRLAEWIVQESDIKTFKPKVIHIQFMTLEPDLSPMPQNECQTTANSRLDCFQTHTATVDVIIFRSFNCSECIFFIGCIAYTFARMQAHIHSPHKWNEFYFYAFSISGDYYCQSSLAHTTSLRCLRLFHFIWNAIANIVHSIVSS